MRGLLRLLLAAAAAAPTTPAAAQSVAQSLELTPSVRTAKVGEPITLTVRLRLHEQDALLAPFPDPPEELPDGFRVLAADSLVRTAPGRLEGSMRVAFYRPGRREVPAFTQLYRRGATVLRAGVRSEPTPVEIVPVLPPGNPPLRDIREFDPLAGPDPVPAAVALGALALAAWALYRRRRARPPAAAEPAPPAGPPPTPYQVALGRLADLECTGLTARGDVARHYELALDALRGYLEDAEAIPARERTSGELLWALPPRLAAGGLRERWRELLDQADLVKFARVRPDAATAAAFLRNARALLDGWHAAPVEREPEAAGALR